VRRRFPEQPHEHRTVDASLCSTRSHSDAFTHTDGRAVEAAMCSTISAMKPIFKVHPIKTINTIYFLYTHYIHASVCIVRIHSYCV
jgi:hypothetical protein